MIQHANSLTRVMTWTIAGVQQLALCLLDKLEAQTAADAALSVMQGGYDLKVGTSERGSQQSAAQLKLPEHCHAVIAFGGPLGLEDCYQRDSRRAGDDVAALFDMWINTCPNQGSRTIRTEEAILISMSYLQPALSD